MLVALAVGSQKVTDRSSFLLKGSAA